MSRLATRPGTANERGAILIVVAMVILLLGALSFSFLQESLAEKTAVDQRTSNLLALEICEKGLVEAGLEILAMTDGGEDGIGTVSGEYAAGEYEVTATQDAKHPDRWVLQAIGTHRLATRRIEVGLRHRARGSFVEGMFAKDRLTFNGTTQTDAYDSGAGTYASQAINNDGGGAYAEGGGHVGSNRDIVLHGSSVTIRGNAIPGPLHQTSMSGSPTVWGDTLARRREILLEDPSLSDFRAALAANDNATLLPAPPPANTGGNGNGNGNGGNKGGGNTKASPYDPKTYALSASGQGTVVLDGGTYIFSDIRLTGQTQLIVNGPTTIYVTGDFDVSGGGFVNNTGRPGDLRVLVHPYWVIPGHTPSSSQVKIRGGSGAAMALYAPGASLSVHGNDDVYGAFVASTITVAGNSRFHYDRALGEIDEYGDAMLERLYWRDLDERLR